MSKEKSTNLRITINVDLTNQSEISVVKTLLRYCNVLSVRSKPRWCMSDIMRDTATGKAIKPGDKWAERREKLATDELIPVPNFSELNKAAAARNNQTPANVACIHRIYPSTRCSICGRGSVSHSQATGGPMVASTHTPTRTTPYVPYDYEAEKVKREAKEKLMLAQHTETARERHMPITNVNVLPEIVAEDGVVYDYEMW